MDAEGRLTQLVGPDPRWVLNAFCTSQPDARRDPVRTTPSDDGWTGTYKEYGTLHSIAILRDDRIDAFVVGDGVDPIPTNVVSR